MKKIVLFLLAFSSSIGSASAFEPELIGGRPAKTGEFPEIVYIRSGGARCSASIIGPRVILTAGHCVKENGSIGPVEFDEIVDFVVDQIVYTAQCKQAPLYRDSIEDHDMALCKVDKPLKVKPASISKEGPKLGQEVILTGYGCVKEGGVGGNDGILRIGKAKVIRLPQDKNFWFYTKDISALCFGDSGGPSMLDEKSHLVIGVNSRGNIKDLSLMTALFTEESVGFMKSFAEEQEVEICGVTTSC